MAHGSKVTPSLKRSLPEKNDDDCNYTGSPVKRVTVCCHSTGCSRPVSAGAIGRSRQCLSCIAIEMHNVGVALHELGPEHDPDAMELCECAARALSPLLFEGLFPRATVALDMSRCWRILEAGKKTVAAVNIDSSQSGNDAATTSLLDQMLHQGCKAEDNTPLMILQVLQFADQIESAESANEFFSTCAYNLGLIEHRRGNDRQSLGLFAKALSLLEGGKAPSSCDDLSLKMAILNNIGRCKFQNNDYDGSLQCLSDALKSAGKSEVIFVLPGVVGTIFSNKARVHYVMGQLDDAMEVCRRALVFHRTMTKDENPLGSALALYNIGMIHFEKENSEAAVEQLRLFVELVRKRVDSDRSAIVVALNTMILMECDVGKHDEGVELGHLTFQDERRKHGFANTRVALALNNIGLIHLRRKQFVTALEFFLEGLRIERVVRGDTHPSLTVALNTIGNVYHKMGNYAEAMRFYTQALDMMESSNECHPLTAAILGNMGVIYYERSLRKEAMRCFQLSLAIQKSVLGEGTHDVADTYHNIGLLQFESGDGSSALESFEASLVSRSSAQGPGNSNNIVTKFMIAKIRQSNGEDDEALIMYKETLRAMTSVGLNPYLVKTLYSMGEIYHERGELDEALTLFQASHRSLSRIVKNRANVPEVPRLLHTVRIFSSTTATNSMDQLMVSAKVMTEDAQKMPPSAAAA